LITAAFQGICVRFQSECCQKALLKFKLTMTMMLSKMKEHFHDKFIVKAKSSVSSHDQSKHSQNRSQTDASVWNRVVSLVPTDYDQSSRKHHLYVIDLIDEHSIIFLSSQINELFKVFKTNSIKEVNQTKKLNKSNHHSSS